MNKILSIFLLAFYFILPKECNLSTTAPEVSANTTTDSFFVFGPPVVFKNMLGINAFEWNFLQDPKNPNDGSGIFEPKMKLIRSFGGVRHYLDWQKIEPVEGSFTFNPTNNGGWDLDTIYQRCKEDSIDVLVCLKNCPDWIQNTYPADSRDAENVPAPYGLDRSKPASYIEQAKAGFQFAARYGSNKNIDPTLIAVNTTPRWTGDHVNEAKTGMNLIKYIECDNERDKWWKGDKAHQSAQEYAANLSAFYDGDKGKLGKGVGVKNADPAMQVVMAGLAATDTNYVANMIKWCKQNRGYKKDGTVDLCFDVVNYHLYANDHKNNSDDQRTVGVAPELCETGQVSDDFVKLASAYNLPVWVTEAGYDVNPHSPQRAISIGDKSALITQADWILRTALLYARHHVQKLFFYELYDDNIQSYTQYASSGLVDDNLVRRPAANYIYQAKKLMGQYIYKRTISQYPLVDEYVYQDKIMYVLMLPDQTGKTFPYHLSLTNSKNVILYKLNPSSTEMVEARPVVNNNSIDVHVTETPVFIQCQSVK
ncbi:MAG TPA: hypothetical protein VK559_13400 [Ferruginibacter sp.]|nr:hypothetical protein [Ferruginibacter sp.]